MLDARALREAQGSFQTHASYLRAFSTLAGFTYPGSGTAMRAALGRRVAGSATLIGLQLRQADLPQVRRSLASAWGAEMLLALPSKYASEDALRRLANNWGAAQLYYVIYHATQALFVAAGNARPESHPVTRRVFENFWCERDVQLAPWSFAAGSGGYRNGPGRQVDERLHPWTRCTDETCWDLAAKALRTTREDDLPGAVRARRQRKRGAAVAAWRAAEEARRGQGRRVRAEPRFALPRLTGDELREVESRLRPYTFMDYIWRLRIKTNYEDATMFTDGPQDEISASTVHRDLMSLAEATLLVAELHIRQLVGAATLRRLVDGWISTNVPRSVRLGLALRRDLLCEGVSSAALLV